MGGVWKRIAWRGIGVAPWGVGFLMFAWFVGSYFRFPTRGTSASKFPGMGSRPDQIHKTRMLTPSSSFVRLSSFLEQGRRRSIESSLDVHAHQYKRRYPPESKAHEQR